MAGATELAIEVEVVRSIAPVPLPPTQWRGLYPLLADEDGIVGAGADLEPSTLLAAYRVGVFPWPHGDWLPWFSPDPRAIIPVGGLHISRRLARTIRQGGFRVTVNACFEQVMRACGERDPDDGTWITEALMEAYWRMHELGWAHSVEVWRDGALVGGLYGMSIGGVFAAESMFHRVDDASKIAMVGFMAQCERAGIELVDVQVLTPHTERMGAVEIPKRQYLRRLAAAVGKDVRFAGLPR